LGISFGSDKADTVIEVMRQLGSTMRVLRPVPNVLAFYDGRLEGVRAYSDEPNWLDDGAYSLGICSYAIVDGPEALVYDTHLSIAHAGAIRQTLHAMAVRSIRVVLSHWHDDHVAGNEVFADCEMIAHAFTATALAGHRETFERGNPPIKPLVLPNRLYEGRLELKVKPFITRTSRLSPQVPAIRTKTNYIAPSHPKQLSESFISQVFKLCRQKYRD
jgi:hypothetical protein